MDLRTKASMGLRAAKMHDRRMEKEILVKKIAQLLAEDGAACSELPGIFSSVASHLTVTPKN